MILYSKVGSFERERCQARIRAMQQIPHTGGGEQAAPAASGVCRHPRSGGPTYGRRDLGPSLIQ